MTTALALVFLAVSAVWVQQEAAQGNQGKAKGRPLSDITIGTNVMAMTNPFMVDLVTGYKVFQGMTNLHLLVTDGGDFEPEKQVSAVENYIAQGVDGILVQCISIDTMKDTIKHAMDAGIPLGYYPHSNDVASTTYFNYVEYDWGSQLGVEASKWVKQKLGGKAKIINVETSVQQTAIERARGWRDVVNKECGAGNIKWVMIEATNTEKGMAAVESALQANPDTNMVLAYDDDLGVGAYEAIMQSGLDTTKMFLGSCDGTSAALDLVEKPNSVYRCSIGNDRFVTEIGFYWLQNMVKCTVGLPYDNPFPITTIAIKPDNVKAYRSRKPVYTLDPQLVAYMNSHKK
jgi:ABC-type sugar transport system substrate-binding protein